MEQEKNLKEEIVAVVDGSLRSFKVEMIEVMDGRFDAFEKTIDGRFSAFEQELKSFDAGMEAGFRGQGVLMEKMQDDIDTLAEGQELLHERIDGLDGRMGRVEDKLDRVEVKLDILWAPSRAS